MSKSYAFFGNASSIILGILRLEPTPDTGLMIAHTLFCCLLILFFR
ncbi:hypothetical protein Barb7_02562 [Bacteroidales bacterium Barb7]|nr:hypothetical protein Barb7_02562 [Bacteroidales bacterium Barb7]